MNFILLFALFASLLNLLKDLFKGYNENKKDVFLDILFVFATLVPCLFNVIFFIRKKCDHFKIISLNFHKIFRMDNFDEFYREKCEKGEWFFCNMLDDWTTPDGEYISLSGINPDILDSVEDVDYKFELFRFSESYRLKKYIKKDEFEKLFPDVGGTNIIGLDDLIMLKLYKDKCNIKVISNRGFVSRYSFNIQEYKEDSAKYIFDNADEFNIERTYRYQNVIVRINKKEVSIKFYQGRSKGVKIKTELNFKKFIWLNSLLAQPSSHKGIVHFRYKDFGEFKLLHFLTIQEIMDLLLNVKGLVKINKVKFKEGTECFFGSSDSEFETKQIIDSKTMFYSNCKNNSNVENGWHTPVSEIANVDLIQQLNKKSFYCQILEKMISKFGNDLAHYLMDYILEFFGYENVKAALFLINRTSCWRYRDIGSNWQSKRFLSDINFIFKSIDYPNFTHPDNNVPPTKRVKEFINNKKLPSFYGEVKWVTSRFDPSLDEFKDDKIKYEEALNKVCKKQKLGKSKSKTKDKVKQKIKANDELILKNVNYKKFLEHDGDFKVNNSKTYCQALKEGVAKVADPVVINKLKQNIFIEKRKKYLMPIKKVLNEVADLRTKIKKSLFIKIEGSFRLYGSTLHRHDNELHIDNYYNVLTDYVDEVENEKNINMGDHCKTIIDCYYRRELCFKKNVFNIKSILSGDIKSASCKKLFGESGQIEEKIMGVNSGLILNNFYKGLKPAGKGVLITPLERKFKKSAKSRRKERKRRDSTSRFANIKRLGKRKECENLIETNVPTKKCKLSKYNIGLCFKKRVNILKKLLMKDKNKKSYQLMVEKRDIRLEKEKEILERKNRREWSKKDECVKLDLDRPETKEEAVANGNYWSTRKYNPSNFSLDPVDPTKDIKLGIKEEEEKYKNKKVTIYKVEEQRFPLIYRRKFYLNRSTYHFWSRFPCIKVHVSEKMKKELNEEKNKCVYAIEGLF